LSTPLIKRDISWLQFNARVLQEAADKSVPLYERLKFLAIYSSNLDEFFRVRVAALRQFKALPKEDRRALFNFKPKKELREIRQIVRTQQEEFGRIFRQEILPALGEENIYLLHSNELDAVQRAFVEQYFDREIKHHLKLHWLPNHEDEDHLLPFVENSQLCLAVVLDSEDAIDEAGVREVGLVPIPLKGLPRFVQLPQPADSTEGHYVIFLDSIIRANLSRWMDTPVEFGYSFKLSRDAELYIENEFDGDLREKIERSLARREEGLPTRFLYDGAMPRWLLKRLKSTLGLSKYDMIPGARYHKFNDFFSFPLPEGREDLMYAPLPPLPHPRLEAAESVMSLMEASDVLLSFPYQQYDYVPQLIREAAEHPEVEKLSITLYRVAGKSAVMNNLLYALDKGKEVEAFVEAKARFDEASNLYWGKELTNAGATVHYSYPAVKVHTKLLHISRRKENGDRIHYSYIGTGNFNEKTAKLYTDHALLTSRPVLGADVERVFQLLRGRLILPNCKKLLVAPFTLASTMEEMIDAEITHAKQGGNAYLFLKMNSLEEPGMINKIREAAAAGVEVKLIVRGICRLVPNPEENIQIISIIDRFLEHARIYIFGNNGQERIFIGSADLMERNLFRRVEVVTPIDDPLLRLELRRVMDMQWRDNQKARIIVEGKVNQYRPVRPGEGKFRAQTDIYAYFSRRLNAVRS
jgi:polyphosphate kinase